MTDKRFKKGQIVYVVRGPNSRKAFRAEVLEDQKELAALVRIKPMLKHSPGETSVFATQLELA
jgi:hypothetical protein